MGFSYDVIVVTLGELMKRLLALIKTAYVNICKLI